VEECVPQICRLFNIDPYAAISEGTLIIACRPHKAEEVVDVLAQKGIPSSIAGELTDAAKGMVLVEGGKEKELVHPIVDPFWRAFYDASESISLTIPAASGTAPATSADSSCENS
jgi:hydrogenase maturation factor